MKLMKYLTRERALAAALACALAAFASFTGEAASSAVITSAQAVELGGAEGGDEIRLLTNDDGSKEIVHIFKTAGDAKLTVGSDAAISADSVRMLLLGGGGGGGGNVGGGGGAGGFLELNGLSLASGDLNFTVGVGGTGGSYKPGTSGGDTSVELNGVTYTAVGGGGGGCWENGSTGTANGRNGGSGGGGTRNQAGTCGSAGTATQPAPGYGNAGGVATASNSAAGGGGGAGATGASGNVASGGAGGAGRESDITGETAFYAAGGGGSTAGSNVGGAGGSGIGGKGADGTSADRNGQAGVNGTGSGGGGGSGGSFGGSGGTGGTGGVIIRYRLSCAEMVVFNGAKIRFGNATASYVAGDLLLTYATGTGALKLPGLAMAQALIVGGGGAGGSGATGSTGGHGGGGGAGGFTTVSEQLFDPGTYAITVGAGGVAVANGDAPVAGENGGDSSIDGPVTFTAVGGGGGGAKGEAAGTGGSGGGGSRKGTSGSLAGGTGTSEQGNDGGACAANGGGGGGGGASLAGGASALRVGGDGGEGLSSSITGTAVYYAGGGGGGARDGGTETTVGTAGKGGLGGGGRGADAAPAEDGRDGLGGGGGGCNNLNPAGSGGDGVVIIRISSALPGPLVKPTAVTVPYTGNEVVLIEPGDLAYTIEGTARATDAGTYHLKVTLKSGFTWTDGTTDQVEFDWTIAKAPNAITGLTMESYKAGAGNRPTFEAEWGKETAIIYYGYPDGSWLTTMPDEPGEYHVVVEIPETANYAGARTDPPLAFTVLAGGTSPIAELGRFAKITVTNYVGSAALTDFQMLVRVSEADIAGFKYVQAEPDGSDIRFTDAEGNVLSHEIDEWNPNGVSYIWVKVPSYGADTAVTMCWGLVVGATLPTVVETDTWNNYAGVWHMSETITSDDAKTAKSADSTAANNPGVPYRYNSSQGNLALMVSESGVVGNARVNGSGNVVSGGNCLLTANYKLGNVFTYSGWFKMTSKTNYPRLGGNRTSNGGDGWSIEAANASSTQFAVRGGGGGTIVDNAYTTVDSLLNEWVYLCFVFNDSNVAVYSNGKPASNNSVLKVEPVKDNNSKMTIGGPGQFSEGTFSGLYDEVRLNGKALSADWIKADYEQMKPDSAVYGYDTAGKTKGVQLVNAWVVEPGLEPDVMDCGGTCELERGCDRSGAISTAIFQNIETGAETTNVLPVAAGEYRVTFVIDSSDEYEGLSMIKTLTILSNRWAREPSISPTTWAAGSDTTVTVDFGADVRGDIDASRGETAYIVYRNCSTGACVTNEMPTEAGYYEAHFIVEAVTDGDIEYGALEVVREFQITTNSPYDDADGLQGASGRILLMNRDVGDGSHPAVDYQGYYDNATRYAATGSTFWEYLNADAVTRFNLQAGTEFILWTMNYEKKLWYLTNCRQGNTFPTTTTGALIQNQTYLPWTSTSKRITAHNNLSVTRMTVGQCVMRNINDAAVYSSCFTDGIGTIYFDAVNGWVSASATDVAYNEIVVEIATNCVSSTGRIMEDSEGNPLPPTDENVMEVTPAHWEEEIDPDNPDNVTSNWVEGVTNTYGRANWQPLPLTVLKRDYPLDWEGDMPFTQLAYDEDSVTNEFQVTDAACTNICLGIKNGGTTNNFYRIYVPMNYHGPARFRIRRVTSFPSSRYGADEGGLILLDNIIVSYPQMRADLSACGWYDPAKTGKQTLGQEIAWNVPFPSHDDEVFARANPTFYTNPGKDDADTSKFVVAAFLNYRWRYLDQVDMKVSPWKKVALNPADNFTALDPLDLPGIPGDVEYYFTLALNAPFYDYADYSGTGLKLGGFYTEELASVTNRAPTSGEKYDSQGTDWFVRLREGKSDYEAINLEVRKFDEYGEEFGGTNVVEMELVGDHVWRGYFQTMTNTAPGGISYRFVAQNLQTPGERTWNVSTNYWRARNDLVMLPASESVMDAGEEDWASMPCDATTGYLLFQLDDSTRSLTIVHADYQNFNGWNDANVAGAKFVGSSTEDEGKKGVSPKARDCRESFSGWLDMPATNIHWTETFTTSVGQEYGDYKTFPSTETPNGWTAGQGMWVYGNYKDAGTGRALQMEGQGRGFIQFVDAAESPRGLESISFNARLGQFINFDNFSYYDAASKFTMTNYTFAAQVAFDVAGCQSFSGGASLSLIARYRPKKGCYEARLEQIGAHRDTKAPYPITGPHLDGSTWSTLENRVVNNSYPRQALSIYRWDAPYGASGVKPTLLYSVTNNVFKFATPTSESGTFEPMYISVSNLANGAVCITAGLKRDGYMSATESEEAYSTKIGDTTTTQGKKWWNVSVIDASPGKRMDGTYGVLAANCDGRFRRPVQFNAAIPVESLGLKYSDDFKNGPASGTTIPKDNNKIAEVALQFPKSYTGCYDSIANADEEWACEIGRTEAFVNDHQYFGFRAVVPTQQLNIYTATAGKTDWKLLATTNFTSFGNPGKPCVFPLYTTKECSVKIAAAGEVEDVRTDLVIDDIELRQWRGASWTDENDRDELVTLIPHWTNEDDIKGHTNFIFTSAWIAGESIRLSAKRTPEGTPASIRSPLFDGSYDRGVGLGMFSFTYTNAQKNVNLLLQIATNINYDAVNNINNLDTNTWVTVTNFSFTTASKDELREGTRSCYFGLHGAHGVMRLLLDPEVVKSVQTVSDPNLFGEIYITDVFCRDEPTLDSGCWWGWNLRTLGPDATGRDGEKRMYLPDLTDDLAKRGLSLALNNSTSSSVDPSDPETYRQHPPFVQTPTFTSNIVGEVTFRARKYDSLTTSQPAQVTLFGSRTGLENGEWERLTYFIVSNNTFSTYTYKTEPNEAFSAFRLAVTGVEGVRDPQMGNRAPEGYDQPVRVLIDEVLVSEAVRARVAFRNVGAFRSSLDGTAYVPDVPSEKEQPLCNESWGVQCEVYAAQLPDEIDFSRAPRVRLYWFDGSDPWGFDSWRTNKLAKSAWLARATGTNLIYRSSYVTAPDAVIPMSTAPGSVVQYGLEVIYYQVGASIPMTNYLSATDWVNPSWYAPVNLNATHTGFSPYNILDTVAPHWAWINEVNIYGEYDYNYNNTDANCQFVEIAVPAEADISGWQVRLVEAQQGSQSVITNVLGVFGGKNLEGRKKDQIGMEDNMVFRVLACPKAQTTGRLKTSDGTLDDVWGVDNPTATFGVSGEIDAMSVVGIQLVRLSGIIEHEIVTRGYDWLSQFPEYAEEGEATNTVAYLNRKMSGSNFMYVGDDDGGVDNSRGVINERGRETNVWTSVMTKTPGRINQGQTINPDHPVPNGSSVIVYATIDRECGHIYQTVGDAVDTNSTQMVIIPKGSLVGTNITYRVDPWYTLGDVTASLGGVTVVPGAAKRTYVATVGVGVSNNVTVVASARVSDELLELGVTDDNRYKPAILDWLSKHKNAFGENWADPDAESVRLAELVSYPDASVITNLTLTQMYWLDMDPTAGSLALMPAVTGITPRELPGHYGDGSSATNIRVRVFAMITNRTDDVTQTNRFGYGKAWAPYVLRGLEPGVTSWDYTPEVDWGWTSVTFKVTGLLQNGLTSRYNVDNWIPLRWFVFNPDSFRPANDATLPFTSDIELNDPYGKETPGYTAGWYDWVQEHGYTPIFYFWTIDTRLKPFTVEPMEIINYYE